MMKQVFVDADIILDLLAKRNEFYQHASRLFTLIDEGKIVAYTSPIIITNIHYILTKIIGRSRSIKYIARLNTLVNILPVGKKIVDLALSSDFKDFEDAIQYYTAIENNIDYLITRNIKDYKSAKITVLTAEDYLILFDTKFN